MKLITSRNHQCLPSSFAMALGIPLDEVLTGLGHDGLEVVLPELSKPSCYRGHHIQELTDFCLTRGWAVTMIVANPQSKHGDLIYDDWKRLDPERVENALKLGNAVLCGLVLKAKGHACAWDRESGMIYDPRGFTYPLSESVSVYGFEPTHAFLVHRIEQ